MKDIFTPKRGLKIRPYGILFKHFRSAEHGDKGLAALGPKIWNQFLSICFI